MYGHAPRRIGLSSLFCSVYQSLGSFSLKSQAGFSSSSTGINDSTRYTRTTRGIIAGQEYRLENVQERFKGKRYKDLDTEDRRRLDNSIIHSTIIRQDEPSEDQSSIYVIFERLNTGGVNLQPQEIRVALYHGDFVRVLYSLNRNAEWRELYGATSKRLKDMEMILRFLAFHYYQPNYGAPMKDFLNRYMAANKALGRQSEKEITDIFTSTASVIQAGIGRRAFRPRRAVNAAVVDSLMAAVADRLVKAGPVTNMLEFARKYDDLLKDEEYMVAVETGTSAEANVEIRFRKAREAFASVR